MSSTSTACKNAECLSITDSDLVVVLMGPTGTGKSHFIDRLTNEPERRSGKGLQPCTNKTSAIRILGHEYYKDRLVLIDTPGFDDSRKSDLAIVKEISTWLTSIMMPGRVKISGILYLHNITDMWSQDNIVRNLLLFCQLTGSAVSQTIITTTMWDEGSGPHHANYIREAELITKNWAFSIEQGAIARRSLNTSVSAWEIIDEVRSKHERRLNTFKVHTNEADLEICVGRGTPSKEVLTKQQPMPNPLPEAHFELFGRADENGLKSSNSIRSHCDQVVKDWKTTNHEPSDGLKMSVFRRLFLLLSKPFRKG